MVQELFNQDSAKPPHTGVLNVSSPSLHIRRRMQWLTKQRTKVMRWLMDVSRRERASLLQEDHLNQPNNQRTGNKTDSRPIGGSDD
jgi:hypothetical protein